MEIENLSDLDSLGRPYICILMSLENYTRMIVASIYTKWGSEEQYELIGIRCYTIKLKETYFKVRFKNNPNYQLLRIVEGHHYEDRPWHFHLKRETIEECCFLKSYNSPGYYLQIS